MHYENESISGNLQQQKNAHKGT